jgi:hypothetical protein
MPWALLLWAVIVIVSMLVVVVLATRWGRDPFGFALLAAVLGPIAIIALIGTHQSDRSRAHQFEGSAPTAAGGAVIVAVDGSEGSARAAAAVPALGFPGAEAIVLTVLPHESQPRENASAPARQEHQPRAQGAHRSRRDRTCARRLRRPSRRDC